MFKKSFSEICDTINGLDSNTHFFLLGCSSPTGVCSNCFRPGSSCPVLQASRTLAKAVPFGSTPPWLWSSRIWYVWPRRRSSASFRMVDTNKFLASKATPVSFKRVKCHTSWSKLTSANSSTSRCQTGRPPWLDWTSGAARKGKMALIQPQLFSDSNVNICGLNDCIWMSDASRLFKDKKF